MFEFISKKSYINEIEIINMIKDLPSLTNSLNEKKNIKIWLILDNNSEQALVYADVTWFTWNDFYMRGLCSSF